MGDSVTRTYKVEFTAYNGYLVFEIIELETQRGMQIRNELVDNIGIRFSLNDEAFLGCMSVHTIASVFDPRFKMLKFMGQKFPGAEEEILLTIVAEIDKLNDNQTGRCIGTASCAIRRSYSTESA